MEVVQKTGIDVSHWQNDRRDIDWGQVAAAGYEFAFMKATESDWYEDASYETNRSEAKAAGLRIGAYHFARPSGQNVAAVKKDARSEAKHFLNIAAPKPGELFPVLDLEGHLGDLTVTRTRLWIRTWMNKVEEAIHVRALVYTNPSTWHERLLDTDEFAIAGSGLWIANWGVPAPNLPADDWAGNGWAFWQFSDHGSVPGIKGDVDLDMARSGALAEFRIPVAPRITVVPSISGDAATGGTLSVTTGDWKGTQPMTFTYEWARCDASGLVCEAIPGQNDYFYTVTAEDFEKRLRARVTASNVAGAAAAEALSEPIVDGEAPIEPKIRSKHGAISARRTIRMKWSGSDAISDDLTFDVRYRMSTLRGNFKDPVLWLRSTPAKAASMKGKAGRKYCYRVRAIDQAGNRSTWSDEKCVTRLR